MKQLNEYILEGLKINSKSKVNKQIKPADENELKREVLKKIIGKETNFNDIDISQIKDLSYLFEDQDITEIDISEWDVSNVEYMKGMFKNCKYLKTTGNLGKWNVSNVKDMSYMFDLCSCLSNIGDLHNWNINDTSMKYAFYNCKKLKTIGDIKHWNPKEPNWDIFIRSSIDPQPRKKV